ncbi:microcephalin [Xiphophorus hellerii]|uniref:microcephalin n=1 Tax=Xiphophorus hellerii TaxID=8084 RepID=UPI0013B39A5D|nr:microcephalin [Xiphophorus hellerii]XP_032409727.1 microcephalin [Xiphophorus hellerii]XP_032409728.1 microcephalin [Xiphophorus hellerii]
MNSSKSSVLKDVVAFVDVWSSDKRANYSKPFIQQLEEMGAQVSKGFNKQVTHVVFSNGHQATWRKAKKRDVQLVSVLWVGRCYDDGVRADESLFPALNDEKNPVMKNRQHRCMLPKHSPERTIENDWRLKKKFEKMVKELPSLEPQVVDTSPIIIDQENGIIYSPALKRSDYMARRLKDMKEKRENISPTASQVADSCSPTGLKPSLGSTPTFLKFISDNESDEALVAEPPAMEEERSSDDEDLNLSGRDSTKPWLSPCQDVPKQISRLPAVPILHDEEVKKVKKQRKSRRISVRKKSSETIKSGDFSQSPLQDTPGKSQILHKERRQSHVKPTRVLPKESENNKLKIPVKQPSTDTESQVSPNAVKSLNCRSSSATVVSAATETSNKRSLKKKTECRTPKKARLSFSALVRSFTVPSECKNVASSSTDGGNDVFEDYFSPSNHKIPILPSLPIESKIEIPFELDPLPRRRKPRKSGICESEKKKTKLEESHCDKYLKCESRRNSGCVQGDIEIPLLGPNSPAVDVKQVTQRQNSLEFSSNSKTTEDAEKLRPASTSGNPPLEKEDVTESEQQKNSDFTENCHSSESGGNECTVSAGFTEIPSVAEVNQNNQADGSLQKMVNKTKAPRTLVMTSMPTEKQQTVLQVVKALGGFSIIDRVCESTTHVVSGEHRRTLNILLGIARGCWILSFEWILWCLEQRQWIPEEPYELSDQFPAAQICRLQRHLSAGEHQQDLFQDQPPMFVSKLSQPPTQGLVELIELCGGTACKTVRQAGICIGKYSGRRPEGSRILSEQWVLDSITNLKILPYDNYDLE